MKVYKKVMQFINKYPGTIAFRLKEHGDVIEKHINPDENIRFVFAGQKNSKSISIPNTFVFALTDKRLLIARKRLLFGYFFYAITPDMFNDIKVKSGIIWGRIEIDALKELFIVSNISKEALDEIETQITQYMMSEKKKMQKKDSH